MGVELGNLLADLKIGDEAGADYTVIETDGTVQAIGGATCWDDLKFPLNAARLDSASGRTVYDFFNGGVNFKSTARYPEEPVSMLSQAEHRQVYGSGVVLDPHIHWYQQQAAVPNFLLAYKKIPNGVITTFETDFTNYTLAPINGAVFTYVSDTLFQISEFVDIDITGFTVSDCIHYVLFRDSANVSGLFAGAETGLGDVTIAEFDVHAKFDMLGSREEYTK